MAERRLNILRVITWLPVGGIERRLVAALPRLAEHFNVQVACIRERGALADELEAAGVPVTLIPFRKRWDARGLRALAALMRTREIDLVHSHMYRSNVPGTVAARMAGVKCVWAQVHNVGTWETRRQAWTDRALCRWRSGVIAVSKRVRDDVMQTLHLPAERVPVIYNGIELAKFQAARGRRVELREKIGVRPETVVVLFTARLVEQKRCADLIRAWGEVKKKLGSEHAAELWIAGDGPLRGALERLAAELGLGSLVKFLGRSDAVAELMGAADVFVLPSTREGFSNALIEAMAAGLAVIATDVGGNAEAVRDGMDGLIVAAGDAAALSGALMRLVSDKALRERLGSSAAVRAEQFSLERMVAATCGLYEQAVRDARGLPHA